MEGLDETIAPLIEVMNRVSYIETLSSCGGHPEESAVQEYGHAVGNVVFEIEDEPENGRPRRSNATSRSCGTRARSRPAPRATTSGGSPRGEEMGRSRSRGEIE